MANESECIRISVNVDPYSIGNILDLINQLLYRFGYQGRNSVPI